MIEKIKPNCYMDFDGPINDNSRRLYQFMIDNIPLRLMNVLSLEEFWSLKRMGIHEVDWLNNNFNTNIDKLMWDEKKRKDIESSRYLKLDVIQNGGVHALSSLAEVYKINIVTRRNNKHGVLRQIKEYGIDSYLSGLTVIEQGKKTKAEVICSKYTVGDQDILIGDTEDDLIAGQTLGICTFFVLSGIRDKWILHKIGITDRVKVVGTITEITMG